MVGTYSSWYHLPQRSSDIARGFSLINCNKIHVWGCILFTLHKGIAQKLEGKHIKNDNFHPIIQFRKGQMLLGKSNSMARLSIIGILQYSCQHPEITCLPTGITVTILGLFLKQRKKLTNDRSMHRIYGLVHSTDVDPAEVTIAFRLADASFVYARIKEKFSGKGARTTQTFKYCRGWSWFVSEFGAYYCE